MGITYREAKRILAKQEEARDVINSYRGMETLGKRLQLRNNKELILKLFEIEASIKKGITIGRNNISIFVFFFT